MRVRGENECCVSLVCSTGYEHIGGYNRERAGFAGAFLVLFEITLIATLVLLELPKSTFEMRSYSLRKGGEKLRKSSILHPGNLNVLYRNGWLLYLAN